MVDNWIAGATKNKGALRSKAKKAGAINKQGNIKESFIDKKAKGKGKIAKEAQLAKTLKKLRK